MPRAVSFGNPWRILSSSRTLNPRYRTGFSNDCCTRICHASTATAPLGASFPELTLANKEEEPVYGDSSPRSQVYSLKAFVLLSRPPQITRDLTAFEKAFFLYQRRLNERLALPFTRYFYYPRGTPGDVGWKRKMKDRQTPARDIGKYNAYGQEGWNDEILVGDDINEPTEQLKSLLQDVDVEKNGRGQLEAQLESVDAERPMPRKTEADRTGDTKSLNRVLDKTLFLVVKEKGKEHWSLPGTRLKVKESLHNATERIIVQAGGPNMNTWVVGNIPMSHRVYRYPQNILDTELGLETVGEKNFFMKARIMAGQADLKDNKLSLEDYQWLAKDELQRSLHPNVWAAISNIICER